MRPRSPDPVILTPAQERPGRACHAVGKCRGDRHPSRPPHHGDCINDQQPSDVVLAHLRGPPSLSFPPLECCRGVRPTQAAKSRPFEKVSIGGAKVAIAALSPLPLAGSPSAAAPCRRWSRAYEARNRGLRSSRPFRRREQHAILPFDDGREAPDMRGAGGRHNALFGQMRPRAALIVWAVDEPEGSGSGKPSLPPAGSRSSRPQTAWSAAMPLPQSSRHPPCRSSDASRTA